MNQKCSPSIFSFHSAIMGRVKGAFLFGISAFLFPIYLFGGTPSDSMPQDSNASRTNSLSFESKLLKGAPISFLSKDAHDSLSRTNHKLCVLYDLRFAEFQTNALIRDLVRHRATTPLPQIKLKLMGPSDDLPDPKLDMRSKMELPEEFKWGLQPTPRGNGNGGTFSVPDKDLREWLVKTNRDLLVVFDAHVNWIMAVINAREAHNKWVESTRHGPYTNPLLEESQRCDQARDDAMMQLRYARAVIIQKQEADLPITLAQKNLERIKDRIEIACAEINDPGAVRGILIKRHEDFLQRRR